MSAEKVAVLRALNAEIIRTPTQAAFDSPESHIGVAKRLQKELPNSHILDQYGNENNPLAHELGTAQEIWTQTEGRVTAVVAGAGTGGTITGLANGLRKHNKDIKVVAADPQGSILALPETLNEEFANTPYKVEGIGYDFIPDVLDQKVVDKWYKTDDRKAFYYARRLISEEGILCGGSSGSAMDAMVRAVKDLNLGKDDTVVVVLPDSIRSYLSKFVDDDWLAANDLLPPTPPPEEANDIPNLTRTTSNLSVDPFEGATINVLRLKPVSSVTSETSCADAIETMRDKGFDQLPVLASTGPRLMGLVTLGNLLSYISRGRATPDSPVSQVMFDFRKLDEIAVDERDGSAILYKDHQQGKTSDNAPASPSSKRKLSMSKPKKRPFVEITKDTPLSALSRFFEWNSAAVVTERDEQGHMKPIAIVTKVDLLTWMVRIQKSKNGNVHMKGR
jgi:cystathionine beta-synthase